MRTRPFHACMLGLAVALSLVPVTGKAQSAERYTFQDAGQPRQFELALDEVALSSATSKRVITGTAKSASAREHKLTATRLAALSGQTAELVLYEVSNGVRVGKPRVVTSSVLFFVQPGYDAAQLAQAAGALGIKATGIPQAWLAQAADSAAALALTEALRATPGVTEANPDLARQQSKKLLPNDPFFNNQWHLRNTGQSNGTVGTDIRVTNVWDTYRGSNVYIAIIDDGLQVAHPDLALNCDTNIDYDINYSDNDPSPDIAGDDHGTSCGGVAAARGNNGIGVSGSAPDAKLVGLRLISALATDSEEASALNWSNSIIHIKSNSWGPADDGATLEGPGTLTTAALSNTCTVGRGGKGSLIYWAGGNGGEVGTDDSNYDGYANSIYSIAISAVCIVGTQSWYSEKGANIVVAAPSSGDNTLGAEIGITTVDRTGADGYNDGATAGEPSDSNYTATFGGTSSATPLAAGVGALMLQANTNLGWRDVQEILIRSATRNHPTDQDWRTNSAGLVFNHKYGGGMISASGAVAMATTWTNLGAQINLATNQSGLSVAIPDNSAAGITRSFTVTSGMRVEHAVVTLSATHATRGQLRIELISPGGMTSVVGAVRSADSGNDYAGWKFMSVRHWGEQIAGTWTVRVADRVAGTSGTLTFAGLTFFGTAGAGLTNQPPVLAAIGNKNITISNNLQFAVTATDSTDNDPITLSVQGLPGSATFGSTNGNGTFTWNVVEPLGVYTSTFFAADKDGTNSEVVLITVNDGSCVPSNIMNETFDGSTSVPAGWTDGGTANDTASHFQSSPNARAFGTGDSLISPAVDYPTQIVFYVDASSAGNGQIATLQYSVGGGAYSSLSSFAVSSAGGDFTFPLTSSPNLSASAGVKFRFASTFNTWYLDDVRVYGGCPGAPPAQTPPTLNAIGNKAVTISNTLQFAVTATPTDGDTVTLTASNLPLGAVFGSTNEIGTFTWTNASPTNIYSVTFNAADDDGADNETITITVNPAGGGGGDPGSFTNILFQGFEPGDGWSITAGSGNISTNNGAAEFPPNQRVRTGTNSWQVINASNVLDLASASIAGFTGRQVRLYLSSTANTGTQGSEASDVVRVYAALDGAAFSATPDIVVAGASGSNARWGYWATNTLATTAGIIASNQSPQTGLSSNNIATLVINLPEAATSIALRVSARNNDTTERWNVDDISVAGYVVGGAPTPGPGLAITTANQTVSFFTSTLAVGGTSSNLVGEISWTNALNGSVGTISAATSWLIGSVNLAVGTNVITVSGTNSVGLASAAVTLIRESSDTDTDGIEDEWEDFYFGSLTNVNGSSDWDGDGFIDLHEQAAGSDPTSTNSLLKATSIAVPAVGNVITWQSEANKNYLLSRSSDLSGGFIGIASNIAATQPLNTYTDAVSTNVLNFYRVELE
jgi:subtilisin-like proprotein convertase family protein